jgi:predicted nucleotidyltransferase component of viral defense system
VNLSRERLEAEAAATGFGTGPLEKVAYLLALLEGFNRHPFLKGKLALKGGTALNLFLFDVPRLSIDIDLNYIGAADREGMLAERPQIEAAIEAVCVREGLSVQKIPTQHAGGSWSLRYRGVYGNTDSLKVDVVYMYRIPLWPPQLLDSHPIGSFRARQVLVLDEYELASGKLAALMARQTSRDLFDAHALLTQRGLERERLRLGFVVYGGMNRKDWRKIAVEDIPRAAEDVESYLLPLLRKAALPEPFDPAGWSAQLLADCIEAMKFVLPFEPPEREFLDRLLDEGEIAPELLTSDEGLQQRIRDHPELAWKALNVKSFKSRKPR